MHKNPHNNTKKCPRVPFEVKEEIREMSLEKSKAKAKKVIEIQKIHAQLSGTMGGSHTIVIHKDDGDEDGDV